MTTKNTLSHVVMSAAREVKQHVDYYKQQERALREADYETWHYAYERYSKYAKVLNYCRHRASATHRTFLNSLH